MGLGFTYRESGRVLGSGGFSEVVHAVCKETGEHVALKKFKKDDRTSVENEARILQMAAANHWVANYVDDFIHEQTNLPVLVLELVPGIEYIEYIQKRSPEEARNEDILVSLMLQMAIAVGALHEQGIVHRDIKLENTIINLSTRQIKLVDLGLAKALDPSKGKYYAYSSVKVGSASYAAPEMHERFSHFDLRVADCYALGVCLFATLVGNFPFKGSSFSIARDSDDVFVESAKMCDRNMHSRRIASNKAIGEDYHESEEYDDKIGDTHFSYIKWFLSYQERTDTIAPWLRRLVEDMLRISPDARASSAGFVVRTLMSRRGGASVPPSPPPLELADSSSSSSEGVVEKKQKV